jgi:hypothetical protein
MKPKVIRVICTAYSLMNQQMLQIKLGPVVSFGKENDWNLSKESLPVETHIISLA